MDEPQLDEGHRDDEPPVNGERSAEQGAESEPRAWGPWATLAWGLLVAVVFVGIQVVALIAWVGIRVAAEPELDPESLAQTAATDGTLLSIAVIASGVVCSGMVLLIASLRPPTRAAEMLALRSARARSYIVWLLISAGFVAASDTLTTLLDRPIVPEFMLDAWSSAASPLLLWTAVGLFGPVLEELLFRGLLLEGWRRSRLGPAGAVVLTSLAWTALHVQYGWYELAQVFVLGLLLGAARLQTGSTWIPLAMHVALNTVATVETAIVAGGG